MEGRGGWRGFKYFAFELCKLQHFLDILTPFNLVIMRDCKSMKMALCILKISGIINLCGTQEIR